MSETMMIYGSGAALMLLMVAFSAHNKKTGWKKKARPSFTEALHDFYADFGIELQAPQSTRPVALTTPAPLDADFSIQLLKLRGALGNSHPVDLNGKLQEHYAAKEAEQLAMSEQRR